MDALRLDLVGPGRDSELADERLPGWVRPSNWYLTGFLIPSDTPFEQRSDDDEDDSLDETPEVAGLADERAKRCRVPCEEPFPLETSVNLCPRQYRRQAVKQRSRASPVYRPLPRGTSSQSPPLGGFAIGGVTSAPLASSWA